MKQYNQIVFGAMMIAIFTILVVITTWVPVISLVTLFFLPLPIIFYRLRYDRPATIITIIAMILVATLIGTIFSLPFVLVFCVLGFVIGESIQKGKSKFYTYMASTLFLLVLGMLFYVISVIFFELNVVEQLLKSMEEVKETLLKFAKQTPAVPEGYEETVLDIFAMYQASIPALFMLSAFFLAFIVITVNFEVIRRFKYPVSKFVPLREVKIPVAIVFIYGFVLLMPFFSSMEIGSQWYLVYINASILLRVILVIQGVAFIHYMLFQLNVPKIAVYPLTVVAIIFGPLTVLMGILDAATPIRDFIKKDKSR